MRVLRDVEVTALRQVVTQGGPTSVVELNANTLIALVKERNALRGEAKASKDRERALQLKLASLDDSARQQAEFVKHLQAQLKKLEAVNLKLLENGRSPIDDRLAPRSQKGNMAQIRAKLPNLATPAIQAGLPTLGKKR